MVGTTRNRVRTAFSNLASADVDETANISNRNIAGHHLKRDDVSRLSEGLEPMHIDQRTLPHHERQQPAREIDALGVHVKDIITTINRLEGLGLQRLKIPLPKIIVLGEQSTGKSSVIEAISEIKTPRSAGTCTRCPLFIKLESPTDPTAGWNARVTLRRTFTYDGKKGRGSDRRFPGWIQLQEPNTVEFMSSDDPNELEYIIVRAQRAVTSPLYDCQEFTKPDIDHLKGVHSCTFSPNVVCISISHPGLPALSFYDLPGIIGQSETPEDVTFVKNLVVDYVKDPEALILVTCSMENDIANSTAGGIARSLKATDRCIGVLTKPDRLLESSCRDLLRDVYENKRLPLGHGYFVVRNLGQDQLEQRLTHEDARLQERHFFDNAEPFATSFRQCELRFGTWNLQTFLSGKLAEQITNKLPIIEEEINARLQDIDEELKQYPEPVTRNASRIIFNVVSDFAQAVRLEMGGEFPHHIWRNNWKALKRSLFGSLLTLKPTMTISGNRDKGIYLASLSGGATANDSIVLESDEESDDDPNGGDMRMSNTPETSTKKRKVEATSGPSPLKDSLLGRSKSSVTPDVPVHDYTPKRTKFRFDAIAQHLEETSNASMPGHHEHKVTNQMTLKTLEYWQLPVTDFFSTFEQHLKSRIRKLFDETFLNWTGMALYESAWKIVEQMVNLNLHQQRTTMVVESLEDETNGVYVFQDEIFTVEKAALLEVYRQARFKARLALYRNERVSRTGNAITPAEESKITKNVKLMELLNQEPYKIELGVAADITTYYMTAARRFHDSVCMRIESKFFKQLRTQLRDELENGLGIHDEAEGHRNAIRLLAENPEREAQRQELLAKVHALRQGQQILNELKNKKYGDASFSLASSTSTLNEADNSSSGMPTPLSDQVDEI